MSDNRMGMEETLEQVEASAATWPSPLPGRNSDRWLRVVRARQEAGALIEPAQGIKRAIRLAQHGAAANGRFVGGIVFVGFFLDAVEKVEYALLSTIFADG